MEPTQQGSAVSTAATARSLSLARRLLGGAGRASMLAYDLAPAVEAEAIAHGLSQAGQLMVAGIPVDGCPATTWDQSPMRVRFDVIKEAPEWSVRITSCAVHLLGVLEWLSDEVRDHYLAEAGLDPRLVEVASAPGGRLGVIRTDRVLVHDCTGVTPIEFAALIDRSADGSVRIDSFPDVEEERSAREVLGQLTPSVVGELLDAGRAGWGGATIVSERPVGGCPHTAGQVFYIDIDSTGLTVMEAGATVTTVTVLSFERPVTSTEDLAGGIRQLLESAVAAQRAS